MEFFRNLENKCGIRLENIVYYKVQLLIHKIDFLNVQDLTHYFVMTAKKDSLVRKGVIRKDTGDFEDLEEEGLYYRTLNYACGIQMTGKACFIRTTWILRH